MRVLLVYPLFPKTFWSYEKILELVDRKVLLPPLGLVTVAAILPQEWEFKLVDRNIRQITEAEWEWAELVILSAMIVQKEDLLDIIREAKRRGKSVACGGPYPTSVPEEPQAAGIDYLILDEGEITLPMFVEAIGRGEKKRNVSIGRRKTRCYHNPGSPLRLAGIRRLRFDVDSIFPRLSLPVRILRHHRPLRSQTPHERTTTIDRRTRLSLQLRLAARRVHGRRHL